MKLLPQYDILYDEDDVTLIERLPDGGVREIAPLSLSAAMAIEGLQRELDRQTLIDSIVTEFEGADPAQVASDLEALERQLAALGLAE